MTYGPWFMVHGLWFMVQGAAGLACGSWFMVYCLWLMVSGSGFTVHHDAVDVVDVLSPRLVPALHLIRATIQFE